jgi:hypothetical protein
MASLPASEPLRTCSSKYLWIDVWVSAVGVGWSCRVVSLAECRVSRV